MNPLNRQIEGVNLLRWVIGTLVLNRNGTDGMEPDERESHQHLTDVAVEALRSMADKEEAK